MSISKRACRVAVFTLPLLFVSFPAFVQAAPAPSTPTENTAVLLATVNIYNATSTQSGNDFLISFDLTNRIGVQPGVKYSIVLIKETKSGQTIVDEHVYSDMVNLGENSSVHKTIKYTAPSNLDGEYLLFLSSSNTSGFPFGMAGLGKVKLQKSVGVGGIIIDNNGCYLTVVGEKDQPHYTALQGVDIATTETLQSNCLIENISNSQIMVTPSFVTRIRSNFGDIVATQDGDTSPVTLSAHEKKMVITALPKASLPQAYNISLRYGSDSNEVSYHYVIQGASGTIQSILLDKGSYMKGETANISFIWSRSANNSLGSRNKGMGNQLTSPSVAVSLADENGISCADAFNKSLDNEGLVKFGVPIKHSCLHPKVKVTLADAKGVLAQVSFDTATSSQKIITPKTGIVAIILAVILATLAIAVLVIYKKKKALPIAPLLLVFVITGVMFTGVGSAKADTFSIIDPVKYEWMSSESGYGSGGQTTKVSKSSPCNSGTVGTWYTISHYSEKNICRKTGGVLIATGTVFLNKTSYAPTNSITLSGSMSWNSGKDGTAIMYYGLSPDSSNSLFNQYLQGSGVVSNNVTYNPPSGGWTPGNYKIRIRAWTSVVGTNTAVYLDLKFTVAAASCTIPAGTYNWGAKGSTSTPCFATISTSQAINNNDTGTIENTASGYKGSISATCTNGSFKTPYTYKCAADGKCGAANGSTFSSSLEIPTAGLCSVGKFKNGKNVYSFLDIFSGAPSTYSWDCEGTSGVDASCKASLQANLRPDLYPTDFSYAYSTDTVSFQYGNKGSVSTDRGFSSKLQTATDYSGTGATDILTNTTQAPALASGAVNGVTFSYKPTSLLYIRACVDSAVDSAGVIGVISESNEENNCTAWMLVYPDTTCGCTFSPCGQYPCTNGTSSGGTTSSGVRTWTCTGPDNTSSVSCTDGTTSTSVATCGTAINSSPVSTAPTSNFCGTDSTKSSGPTETNVSGIGTTQNCSSGKAYVWYCTPNTTGSSKQCAVCKTAITNTLLPDLTAGSVTPTTATAGTASTFSATISNTGAASTGTTGFTNLFQKATDANGTGAAYIGTSGMSLLGVSSTGTASLSYTFTTAGTYNMRVCADKSSSNNTGVIDEGSNENNNCGAWTTIIVTDGTTPTASLTVNGAKSATVAVGNSASIAWSSTGGTKWGSTYSFSGTCTARESGSWVPNSSGGTYTSIPNSSRAGCTFSATYTVTNAAGRNANSSITIIIPSVGSTCTNGATNYPTCINVGGGGRGSYGCSNSQCVQTKGGTYTENTCGGACGGGGGGVVYRYSCSGTNGSCTTDTMGQYYTSNCNNACGGTVSPTCKTTSSYKWENTNAQCLNPSGAILGICTASSNNQSCIGVGNYGSFYVCKKSSTETCTCQPGFKLVGGNRCEKVCTTTPSTCISASNSCGQTNSGSGTTNSCSGLATCNAVKPDDPPVTVSGFTARPPRVNPGDKVTLSWTSTGANTCTIKKNGADFYITPSSPSCAPANSYSATVSNQTTFSIHCKNTINNIQQSSPSILVNVTGTFNEF